MQLFLAFVGGVGIGFIYFTVLWHSVRHLSGSRHPVMLGLGSLLLRLIIAIAGFYFIGADDWRRFLLAVAGFVLLRIVLVRRWGKLYRNDLTAKGNSSS